MTYLYLSDECAKGLHRSCAGVRDVPTDPEACGGGVCTCRCHTVLERSR